MACVYAPLSTRKPIDAGIKVTDEELAAVSIERDEFHGEWNYRIRPRLTRSKL
jgi:hypothetical protein